MSRRSSSMQRWRVAILPLAMVGTLGCGTVAPSRARLPPSPWDAAERDCRTPLHAALRAGAGVDVVRRLVEEGADVKARTPGGWTPLHLAARYSRSKEVLKLLLERGADANVVLTGPFDITPLALAVRNGAGSSEVVVAKVLVLLAHGADAAQTDPVWGTLLHLALCRQVFDYDVRPLLAVLLAHGAPIDARDMDRRTPLHATLGSPGGKPAIEFLLDHGADPAAARRNGGITILEDAARFHEYRELVTLLQRGLDPFAGRTTPWAIALENGQPESAKEALAVSFQAAVDAGNAERAIALLRQPVRLPAKVLTASLEQAVVAKRWPMVKAIVAEVGPRALGTEQRDAIRTRAAAEGQPDLVALLGPPGPIEGTRPDLAKDAPATDLEVAANAGDPARLSTLLRQQPQVPAEVLASVLERAMTAGRWPVVKVIVTELGPRALGTNQQDAIRMRAAFEGQAEIVALLVSPGQVEDLTQRVGRARRDPRLRQVLDPTTGRCAITHCLKAIQALGPPTRKSLVFEFGEKVDAKASPLYAWSLADASGPVAEVVLRCRALAVGGALVGGEVTSCSVGVPGDFDLPPAPPPR
jgi:ankyrin repeat protein